MFDVPKCSLAVAGLFCAALALEAVAAPSVVLISLDGATPRLLERYLEDGTLPRGKGLDLLRRQGVMAERNITVTPSLTAPGHIAIATGSSAAHNDVVANSYHLLASPFASNVSGFGAPIGGYSIDGPAEAENPTALPIWRSLRDAGKQVVTATFPGADGVDVRVPGLTNSPIVQPSAERTVDYTVPFGEFGGVGARGFSLGAGNFVLASDALTGQLAAAGHSSYGPARVTTAPVETVTLGGVSYPIMAAAIDSSDDATLNYDTLVFFDANRGIEPGPFALPATGPAYVRAAQHKSARFYFEGSPRKVGTAFYVSYLAPDLSSVRFARYGAANIPPNAAVQAVVDDINADVGFWAPQADFRIPERLSPGFDSFPDEEVEAIYEDQVETFVDYQTRVALRAIERNPTADLVMIYIEQPDGSSHQFLISDPRQATDPRDPASIGKGQDLAKRARYRAYLARAYQVADAAVQRIIEAVGVDRHGKPASNVLVVSDHGFDPFHTAVSMNALLASAGIPSSKVRAVTSGPAVNIYINLAGREPNGTVTPSEYVLLQGQVVELLRGLTDTNPAYALSRRPVPVFDKVFKRPVPADLNDPAFGRSTTEVIGQDSGDVFALLATGYNFDGTQSPVVNRLGDTGSAPAIFSVPNFYGAHGYDPALRDMSAIFLAAGPAIRKGGRIDHVRNIDIAPTIAAILGVRPAPTVEGRVVPKLLRAEGRWD